MKLQDTETLVCQDIMERQQLGIKKYGTTLANNPAPLIQWLQEAYEEALDQVLYLKRVMQEIEMQEMDNGNKD